jgi:hypothetical protein
LTSSAYGTEIPVAPGYYVYRLWAGDACLYVGRVGDSGPRAPQPRLNHHRRVKPWWAEVTRIEVAAFPDHPSIVAEEGMQIVTLKPLHNKQRGSCLHDLSIPGAVKANGSCRACENKRPRTPGEKTRKNARDRARQSQHNAAKRRRVRAPGAGQQSLW